MELDLRAIKTTLGMQALSCKTPDMAIQQTWVYLLAYNLIRLIMAQAAVPADCLPRELSFKHSLQLWVAWGHSQVGAASAEKIPDLLVLITQQRVGDRPGRIEPRGIKRRPKNYPLLTKPRSIARAHVRKHGHPRKVK